MCIFCKIVNNEIPSSRVYEDDKYLAILDLSQATYGHTIVMPKKHYDTILDMPNEEVGELMKVVQKTAVLLVNKLQAKGCNILNNTNEVAGQTVMHTHVHILPRYNEDDTVSFVFRENKTDLDSVLKHIQQ